MLFKTAAKYIGLTWETFKMSLKSAMSFKFNFYSQVLGMMLNNIAFFSIYLLYYSRFQEVNGWTLADAMVLNGLIAVAFGLLYFVFGGILNISVWASKGGFDKYFGVPKNMLWQVATSKSEVSALGDFVYGFIMTFAAVGLNGVAWLKFLVALIVVVVTYFSFLVLTQSWFFFSNKKLEQTEDFMSHALLSVLLFPQTIFDGARFVFMFILPVFFMGFLPVRFILGAGWMELVWMALFAVVEFGLAVGVFSAGLRRYESGGGFNVSS